MLSIVVAVCVVVAVSAHGGGNQPMTNWNQMQYGNQMQGMQSWMNGMGMNQNMGNGMNNMMGNGMNNMMGNGMNQQMGNGMNQQMGNGMNQQRGNGMNQNMNSNQNMMSQLMMMLLNQNMMGGRQNMGGNNGGNNGMSQSEREEVEALMKYKMMTEMADMIMMYMEYKKTEEEFGHSMEALCFLVNATWEATKMGNTTPFNHTTDAGMDEQMKIMENWSEKEKMDYTINMMQNNEAMYGEVFFRMATWACVAGHDYMKAATMMDESYRKM